MLCLIRFRDIFRHHYGVAWPLQSFHLETRSEIHDVGTFARSSKEEFRAGEKIWKILGMTVAQKMGHNSPASSGVRWRHQHPNLNLKIAYNGPSEWASVWAPSFSSNRVLFYCLKHEDGICGFFGLELLDRIDMNPPLFTLEDRVFCPLCLCQFLRFWFVPSLWRQKLSIGSDVFRLEKQTSFFPAWKHRGKSADVVPSKRCKLVPKGGEEKIIGLMGDFLKPRRFFSRVWRESHAGWQNRPPNCETQRGTELNRENENQIQISLRIEACSSSSIPASSTYQRGAREIPGHDRGLFDTLLRSNFLGLYGLVAHLFFILKIFARYNEASHIGRHLTGVKKSSKSDKWA